MNESYPIEELVIDARSKDWEIFSPNWEYLSNFPTSMLAALVGLSLGIHPWFSHPAWVFKYAIPYFEGQRDHELDKPVSEGDFEKAERLKEFLKRIHIAVGNLAPHGSLHSVDGLIQGEATYVKATDFITFATSIGWQLPDEFERFQLNHPTVNKKQDTQTETTGSDVKPENDTQSPSINDGHESEQDKAVKQGVTDNTNPLEVFKEMDNLEWKGVSIHFTSLEDVKVSANRETRLAKFNNFDTGVNSRNGNPSKVWEALRCMAISDYCGKNIRDYNSNAKDAMRQVRTLLKKSFGISENPIKNKTYTPVFHLSVEEHVVSHLKSISGVAGNEQHIEKENSSFWGGENIENAMNSEN